MPKKTKESTPVQVLFTPDYLLITGKVLNAVSPKLASKFAAKLFLTPFRYRLPKREQKMDRESVKEDLIVPAIDRQIILYHYGKVTARHKVLLVHGWSGRGTQLSAIAEALVEQGYGVISFDAPAHGKAPGKTSMMPYFIESIHEIHRQYGPFLAAVGHSLGGMSLLKAVKEDLPVKKLVIIGTANSVTRITREFAKNLNLGPEAANRMKEYFDEKFGEDMDTYSGANSAKEVNIPTLVVHDKTDVDVKVDCAYQIADELENPSLYITDGLGHRRILGDTKVINRITTFIAV